MKEIICTCCGGKMIFFLTGNDFILQSTNKEFYLYKCKKCGLEEMVPMPTRQEISAFYPTNYYSYIDPDIDISGRFHDKLLVNLLSRLYNNKPALFDPLWKKLFFGIPYRHIGEKKFLDIGCGSGQKVRLLEKYGRESYGFEIGETKIENNVYYAASLITADFGDKKFDFISVSHVLEHVPNPHEFIEKIFTLLQDDGELHLNIPNTSGAIAKIFVKSPTFIRDFPRHLINYNRKSINILFNAHGFKVVKEKALLSWFLGTSIEFYFQKKYNNKKINLQKHLPYRAIIFFLEIILWIFGNRDHMGFIIKKDLGKKN